MSAASTLSDRSRRVAQPSDVSGTIQRGMRLGRGLTWRRVGWVLLVVAAFATWSSMSEWLVARYGWNPSPVGLEHFLTNRRSGLLTLFVAYASLFGCQMVALTAAENIGPGAVARALRLVLAFALGTLAGAAVAAYFRPNSFTWAVWWGFMWGGPVTVIYFTYRRSEELAAALHRMELGRLALSRKTIEAHLQLVQAQVEPQFLFNGLRRIGELYESSPRAADRMLESLIAYLRAALPQMRTGTSTLGQELRLAQAYLDIQRIGSERAVDLEAAVPDALAAVPFPPMVLLPLIEAFEMRNDVPEGRALVRVEAREATGAMHLKLLGSGGVHLVTDQIATIRERLGALYGQEARLDVGPQWTGNIVVTLHLGHVTA
jgi:hypothetical protein